MSFHNGRQNLLHSTLGTESDTPLQGCQGSNGSTRRHAVQIPSWERIGLHPLLMHVHPPTSGLVGAPVGGNLGYLH